MIAEALRLEIEDHARRIRRNNPLVLGASAGEVPPETVGRYLVSLRHLIGHSQACLTRARDRAVAGEMHDLAEHFGQKVFEEDGHEAWAVQDLSVLSQKFGISHTFEPVAAIHKLTEYLYWIIEQDPRLYLAYALWAEYLVVIGGGSFVDDLVENCEIPRGALTCLGNHIELDADHADEGLEVIDRHVTDPALLPGMREVVLTAARQFDRACEEMFQGVAAPIRVGAA